MLLEQSPKSFGGPQGSLRLLPIYYSFLLYFALLLSSFLGLSHTFQLLLPGLVASLFAWLTYLCHSRSNRTSLGCLLFFLNSWAPILHVMCVFIVPLCLLQHLSEFYDYLCNFSVLPGLTSVRFTIKEHPLSFVHDLYIFSTRPGPGICKPSVNSS